MGKLIDADVLMARINLYEFPGSEYGKSMVENCIESIPSAVVLCKDCIHSVPNDGKLVETARYCSMFCDGTEGNLAPVWDADFCSNGEVRK